MKLIVCWIIWGVLVVLILIATHFILKMCISIFKKIIFNAILLIINYGLCILSDMNEYVVVAYTLFFILIVLGILMRILTPIISNSLDKIVSKYIHKKEFTPLTFEELETADPLHSITRCRHFYVSLKLLHQVLIIILLFKSF